MLADEQTRVVIHREWVFPAPVHESDVEAALAAARARHAQESAGVSDITFRASEDFLAIGYTVECESIPDGWERRARDAEAKLARVAALAGTWSQNRHIALKWAEPESPSEVHIRPVHEAADLLLAALADPEAAAGE